MNQKFSHPRGLRLGFATLIAGLMLGSVAPAKAGELDVQLLGWGRENVLYLLHEHNAKEKAAYKNVGVLPFKVINGKNKGYDVAPLSLGIVPRLENALILGQDSKGAVIGIVRDATSTAAAAKALKSYQSETCTKKDFDKLFEADYVRAWGTGSKKVDVKVDAFLTGVVENPHPKDARMILIKFQIIDKDCYDAKEERVKPKDLGFEMAVFRDRDLLSDLGIAHAVPPSKLKRFLSRDVPPSERDKESPAWDDDEKEKRLPEVGGLTFKLYYKAADDKSDGPGKEQELKWTGSFFDAPQPAVGSKVSLVLVPKGPLDRTIGVVLKVNGQSIWQKQDQPSILCDKWLFTKGRTKQQVVEGFYNDVKGDNLEPFEVVEDDTSLAERAGWIEVDFFAEGSPPKHKEKSDPKQTKKEKDRLQKDREADNTMVLSARGVNLSKKPTFDGKSRRINTDKLTSSTLDQLQKALKEANNVNLEPVRYGGDSKVRLGKPEEATRSVIKSTGKAQPGGDVGKGEKIPNVISIGTIPIRYNPRAKK
jgi:hypothetical protein